MKRKVLCLDWDKRSVRIVVARIAGAKMFLEDAHSHRLPNTVDADDPTQMGELIQQLLRRHRLRFKSVLVDVPRERAVINRLTLPPTPVNEVASAVRFQAMRELPFSLDSAAIDYVITRKDESGQVVEVLLAAVTLESLDRIRATCLAAGLTPARIGLRPYANLVSARHVEGDIEDGHALFVDVGPGATEIDVFDGDTLVFARSANVNVPVPVGDGSAREDSRIISLAEIADLDVADGAIEAAVEELLVETTRTLQAYRASDPDAVIDRVIVAGGTGIEEEFAAALEDRLGYAVKMYDPSGPLDVEPRQASKLRSFSAALGLAWSLGREGLLALDFLNPKRTISKRETIQQRARTAGLAAAVVLLAAFVGVNYWYRTLDAERESIRDVNKSLRNKKKDYVAVQDQIDRAREWEYEAVWPDELLRVTRAAKDYSEIRPGEHMLLQSMDFDAGKRNQKVTLRNVHVANREMRFAFVEALNNERVDGKPVYRARARSFSEITGGKFAGKLDIEIDLVSLQAQKEDAKKKEKERTRRRR